MAAKKKNETVTTWARGCCTTNSDMVGNHCFDIHEETDIDGFSGHNDQTWSVQSSLSFSQYQFSSFRCGTDNCNTMDPRSTTSLKVTSCIKCESNSIGGQEDPDECLDDSEGG